MKPQGGNECVEAGGLLGDVLRVTTAKQERVDGRRLWRVVVWVIQHCDDVLRDLYNPRPRREKGVVWIAGVDGVFGHVLDGWAILRETSVQNDWYKSCATCRYRWRINSLDAARLPGYQGSGLRPFIARASQDQRICVCAKEM